MSETTQTNDGVICDTRTERKTSGLTLSEQPECHVDDLFGDDDEDDDETESSEDESTEDNKTGHEDRSSDGLVSDYTKARHIHTACDNMTIIDVADSFKDPFQIEKELEARGVCIDKLREFFTNYAEAKGIDY